MPPKSQLNGPKSAVLGHLNALFGCFRTVCLTFGVTKWPFFDFEVHFLEFQDFGFCMGSGCNARGHGAVFSQLGQAKVGQKY